MAVDSSTTDAIQQALQDVEHLVREEPTQEEPQPTKEVGVPFLHEEDGAELSDADQPIDLQQLLKDTTYVGEVPYSTITESITTQFEDYIGTDDSTDYVDIFYDQLHASYQQMEDEDEYHDQKREILNDLQDQFISFMATEFEQRLGITITSVEEEDIRYEEIEDILRECYTYFILSARENFMTAITKDLAPHLTVTEDDNDSSLQEIQTLLLRYSPIITTLTPSQFLQLTDGEAIQGFYEEDAIVGNFLKKYALKLYQYPEFEVKLINNISLASIDTNANASDVYTKDEIDSKIAAAVAGASHLKRSIVADLPDAGEADANTIYMLKKAGTPGEQDEDNYDEYFVIEGKWEKIGDTVVDLIEPELADDQLEG